MKRAFRFWLVYTFAWIPYGVSYVAIFVQQGSQIGSAVSDAAVNIISAALLGVGVLWLCRRLPWSLHGRSWFFPVHLALAVLYASSWVFAVSMVFSALISIETGRITFAFLRSFALQWEFFSGLMIYATLASVACVMEVTANLREKERRAKEMELRIARAEALQVQTELTALRAKLNPHFLFNTLHTVMALVRSDRAEAEAAIEHLSSLLRYVIRETDNEVAGVDSRESTFEDEWKFVQDYLALEQLRLGDRLEIEANIDPAVFEAILPLLSLQPLIENAIKHSIAPRAGGGKVSITATIKSGDLLVSVSDDGIGATRDQIEDSRGLGLRLIAKTLDAQYDGRAQLHIETSPGQGFTVQLRIPQNGRLMEQMPTKEVMDTGRGLWSFGH